MSPKRLRFLSLPFTIAALFLGVLTACDDDSTPSPQVARADIKAVFPQGVSASGVARVHVEVRGAGVASIGMDLSRVGDVWQGTVDNLPPGVDCVFEGTAFNAASLLLFKGEAGPISAKAGSTVGVAIPLQPQDPSPPENAAPVIDGASLSSEQASGGETVTAGLTAHDPEGTALQFSWEATQGVLLAPRNTPSSSEVDWKAPECLQGEALITASVTDAKGAVARRQFSIRARQGAACGDLTVYGIRNRHHVSADGSVRVVSREAGTTLGAWVPTADGLGYTWHAGTYGTDGTFQIPDVDAPSYLLQDNSTYVWTHTRTPDMSQARLGRPAVPSEPDGTQFTFQLSGLSPWQEGDDIQLHSTETGLGYFTIGCMSPDPSTPGEGETAFGGIMDYGASLRACSASPVRFEPTAGDTLYATQLVSRSDDTHNLFFLELRRSIQVAAPVPQAGNMLLNAALAPLPTTPYQVNYSTATFEALALAAHPTATLSTTSVNLGTLPAYTQFGGYASWPDLALLNWQPNRGPLLATFTYGNPFPSTWDRFITAQTYARVSYSVDLPEGGTSTPTSFSVSTYIQEPLSASGTSALTAQVGPPRDVRLNQTVATAPLTGVGLTPLASWAAPALGTAHFYSLRLFELGANAAKRTTRQQVASFLTDQTQLRLPPGVLKQEKSYYLEVTAVFSPGTIYSKPFLSGAAYSAAVALTSRFAP
ncbi:hypothetical protein POL68_28485 [Stigmatella sp. ncwal1]|uniref:Uncharacterized protein n=1 Tax=Stigmatella ashevillensis TaxID=2995309 RepID=A0ABT5DFP7_9BACT|nr:hypothetical protein [Stigmatella ashevillena]MDC0712433.1 hypothetical protein [Stigmatella ashevillena]